jgi:hypothetical protein
MTVMLIRDMLNAMVHDDMDRATKLFRKIEGLGASPSKVLEMPTYINSLFPATKKVRRVARRTPIPRFLREHIPSKELSAIVGSKPIMLTEATKKLWQYIRKNGLQDTKNRRMINANDGLFAVLKKRQVNMFDLTKIISKHLKPIR